MANLNSRGRHNSLNGRRTTSGSPKSPAGALSFPTIKQRGYYSDILGEEAKNEIGVSIEVILDREQWPFRVSHSANLCLYEAGKLFCAYNCRDDLHLERLLLAVMGLLIA